MKKIFLYMLPFLAVACSTEELENVSDSKYDSAQELQGVVMTIPDFNWMGETRTSLTEAEHGMTFSWVEGDQVGVYASESMANFNIETIGSDAKSASFDGGGFSLTQGSTYYAFSPYNIAGTDKTAVPVSYTGQTQSTNTNANHLGAYDFMASQATAYDANKALFNFAHLGAVMRVKLAVPAGINYQSLKITSPDTPFVTAGTVDLTAETPVITATETSNEITLGLDFTTSGDTLLTLYTMVSPVDMSSSMLTLTLTDDSGREYTTEVAGKNMQAGSAYGYEGSFVIEDDTPYVTFTAEAEQTFLMSEAVSTLEYSVNGGDWAELGTTQVTFGGMNGNLRLRGKSSVGTNGAHIELLDPTVGVACSGDIRTLVDYENYTTVNTGNATFKELFSVCIQLTEAPKLPATTLAEGCYAYMFYYCKSLTQAPELPATTLADRCYSFMFQECTSLTEAPELPATTLAQNCYEAMFSGCTSLTQAPELPATTLAYECYHWMFSGCSSLTEAPELPATTLAGGCYEAMFSGCTSLTQAPELPATTLAGGCYRDMFSGCTSLTQAPELPATNLADNCYEVMFSGCTSLTQAPELPATELTESCYSNMFTGCTSLTQAPELPATNLADYCYNSMFYDCTSLTQAPELPATSLAPNCYCYMFIGCEKLSYIRMMATDISATTCLENWVMGVSSTGTFVKNSAATWDVTGFSGIPEGWTVETADE